MSKYKFNNAERFFIWKNLDFKCFWCGEPLIFKDVSVDHVLPESLLDRPEELERIKISYNLRDDFQINDFCNWVPSHSNCNSRKNKTVFENSPSMIFIIEELKRKSVKTKSQYKNFIKRQNKDKVTGRLISELENGKITDLDLAKLLKNTNSRYAWHFPIIESQYTKHVPEGWEVVSLNKSNNTLSVTDGRHVGTVPTELEPDKTWYCHNCKSWGPWNGNRCLICGYWGDID